MAVFITAAARRAVGHKCQPKPVGDATRYNRPGRCAQPGRELSRWIRDAHENAGPAPSILFKREEATTKTCFVRFGPSPPRSPTSRWASCRRPRWCPCS